MQTLHPRVQKGLYTNHTPTHKSTRNLIHRNPMLHTMNTTQKKTQFIFNTLLKNHYPTQKVNKILECEEHFNN